MGETLAENASHMYMLMHHQQLLLATGLLPSRAMAANTSSFERGNGNLDFGNWVDRGMTNGAARALSLLPTAGALLSAPAREMCIVYRLVSLADLLSVFPSLGGSITPSNVGEYDPAEPFSYGGFMPTTRVTAARPRPIFIPPPNSARGNSSFTADTNDPEKGQAEDGSGGGIETGIFFAMTLKLVLVIAMLMPMWYAQRGALTWRCMYFRYLFVTAVSYLTTLALGCRLQSVILETVLSNEIPVGSGYSRTCFYVVVSVQGISRMHGIAQIVSNASSVAVFAFGTALFASVTLVSIFIALMNKPTLHKLVKSENEAGEYIHAIAKLDLQLEIQGHVIMNG
ncbi:hypothetical protein EDB81DRAFT_840495 [Dactylonectria macrodidyma]|uniref:Uncharacterized protein n=1 Tax=Dactylonectria macrodidyma TaxID=307937 RepID=A0A9P9FAN3_9HYPO|nr:hypothetical protein EDB81DRAFT_840495 [Dactylonectria macrodidyma]